MGGSVNLQSGGQYSMPNIQGYGQSVSGMGRQATGFERGIRDFGMQDYGIPPGYDAAGLGMNYSGNYGGNYGGSGGYGNVSTGGKGFQQQPSYQPAPVMQPYVDQVSTGGKGFQPRPTPAQATAYAPMNIPQMQLAQPSFYYPNIGSQMANLNTNYGIGGLGAMGAFGNYPMMPRQPAPMQMYPALQPPTLPPARPPGPPLVQPSVSSGGKGFQSNPAVMPDTYPTRPPYISQPALPPTGGVPQDDMYLRPVSPDILQNRFDQFADEYPQTPINYPQTPSLFVPGYTGPTGTLPVGSADALPFAQLNPDLGNFTTGQGMNEQAFPTSNYQEQPPIGASLPDLPDLSNSPVEATSPVYEEPSYIPQANAGNTDAVNEYFSSFESRKP